jgi:hypothetical protein
MLDALLKVWPILAGIGGVATAVLVYLGAGVWKVAKWTSDHDSRVGALTDTVTRIDQRVQVLEQQTLTHNSAIIRLEARK